MVAPPERNDAHAIAHDPIDPISVGQFVLVLQWSNDAAPDTLENWFKTAKEHEGSWWPDWADWITTRSGTKISAPTPGDGKLDALEDAPGSYVRVKSE